MTSPLWSRSSGRRQARAAGRARGSGSKMPGVAACVAVAVVATLLNSLAVRLGVEVLSGVFLAIALGLAWHTTRGVPETWKAGIKFCVARVLRLAIILLGLRFSLAAVLETGVASVLLIVVVIAVAFGATWALSQLLGVNRRLGLLIGVGTAICGNSAIAAAAPVLRAKEEEISFASATITLFGTIAIFLYPLIGAALGLDNRQFGLLAGVSVHDSAQAIASGFIFSQEAGGIATIAKLTRTAFLVPVLLILSLMPLPGIRGGEAAGTTKLSSSVPWFAFGFVLLAAVRTVGDAALDGVGWWESLLGVAEWLAGFLIVVAMAGVGLQTSLTRMRAIGPKPFYVGLGAALVVTAVALFLIVIV